MARQKKSCATFTGIGRGSPIETCSLTVKNLELSFLTPIDPATTRKDIGME